MPERVLIVEDDREITDLVALHLRDLGLAPERAADGRTGLAKALAGDWSLIVLDLMLPQLDGLTVCRRIREGNPYTPILMLTARVKALLRRVRADREALAGRAVEGRIELGDLALDLAKRRVTLKGRPVELTAKEFDLLALFLRNPGRAYSRPELLAQVWGYQYEGYEHTVNSHINRLRGKIERDPAHPVFLRTVWGVGYRSAEPGELTP